MDEKDKIIVDLRKQFAEKDKKIEELNKLICTPISKYMQIVLIWMKKQLTRRKGEIIIKKGSEAPF